MKPSLLLTFSMTLFLITLSTELVAKHKVPILSQTIRSENGRQVRVTLIHFDKYTTNEDVIQVCSQLSQLKIKLTFNKLVFGKSVLGLVGRNRIKSLVGQIELADGTVQEFNAGGITNFRSVRIQLSQGITDRIEMIETID